MTEAEWLAYESPTMMIQSLRGVATDRKFRLFGCACYRALWLRTSAPALHWDVLNASEAYAERRITKQEFKFARKRVPWGEGPRVSGEAWEVAYGSSRDCCGETSHPERTTSGFNVVFTRARPEEVSVHRALLLDIFGPLPFRPITFSPSWRTDTAVALARQMYESRDFGAMPILADALQDVGCENEDILNHCRDANQSHVRGCWVVDLLLGKE